MEIYKTVQVVRKSDGAECVIAVHELKANPELYKTVPQRATDSGSQKPKPKSEPKKGSK